MYPLPNDIYRHYKGNYYRIVCVAKHTEEYDENHREKEFVICQCLSTGTFRARPIALFHALATIDDPDGQPKQIPRFTLVSGNSVSPIVRQ